MIGREARKREGQALVEFAMIVPLILFILMGTIELGRAWSAKQIVTSAAREGGRTGILPASTTTEVETAVTNYVTGAGLTGTTVVTTEGVGATVAAGTQTTVTVNYDFEVLTGSFVPGFSGTVTLTGSTVMRHE